MLNTDKIWEKHIIKISNILFRKSTNSVAEYSSPYFINNSSTMRICHSFHISRYSARSAPIGQQVQCGDWRIQTETPHTTCLYFKFTGKFSFECFSRNLINYSANSEIKSNKCLYVCAVLCLKTMKSLGELSATTNRLVIFLLLDN